MLDEGRIDIALTELSDSAAFNTTLLMQDEIKAIVPRNHPLAAQASVTMIARQTSSPIRSPNAKGPIG